MEVDITNKELLKLYTTGKSKKYPLQKDVIEKYFLRINSISASNDIYDLWKDKAINFEKLIGYVNRYSMRLNNKYRLEIDVDWINDDNTIGIFNIKEISKHYE